MLNGYKLSQKKGAFTFWDASCEGFVQRGKRRPTWSHHPKIFDNLASKVVKDYLALVLFDAVQENCLKKKGIKRNIEIFHPGHVVVVGEVGVKEDPEHDFDDQHTEPTNL